MPSDARFLICFDFGLAKVGVAVGSLVPTTPLPVIRYARPQQLLDMAQQAIASERPEGIVLGWPADHLTISTPQTETIRRFGESLSGLTGLPAVYHPETLTTQLAQKRMIAAGVSKSRRRELEDSYAAAAILDDYLESIDL
jgi:putative Holliday junction resolvase